MKIGVFDSGIGGRSVANAIEKAFPQDEVLYMQDQENVPYGTKSPDVLFALVLPILEELVRAGCDVIVVACNTVTTTIIGRLRDVIDVSLVGIEPMVKPAVEKSKSKVITVCATPTTMQSERYQYLKQTYAADVTILEPDCSRWSEMIEHNTLERAVIHDVVEESIQRGADVLVMGCTHYHWIADEIAQIAHGRALVLQPEQSVINRLKQVTAQLG